MPQSLAFNTDCMEALRQMKDNEFDLAVVDPPYGVSIKGGFGRRKNDFVAIKYNPKVTWDDEPPSLEYFIELFRVSKNQIIWGGNYFTDKLYPSKSWLVWDKKYMTDQLTFSMAELAWTSLNNPIKVFYKTNNEAFSKKIHPTEKPIELYDWIFKNFASPGMKILDTHLGSGSSRIAAWDAGLDFVGYEIDKTYFDKQEERFARHAAQQNLFLMDE